MAFWPAGGGDGHTANRRTDLEALLPRDESRRQLLERVLAAPVVPARANQRYAAGEIVDAFPRGLGPTVEAVLGGYMDRAAAGLIQCITEEQRRVATKPSYGNVVEMTTFDRLRIRRPETTTDRYGDLSVTARRNVVAPFHAKLIGHPHTSLRPEPKCPPRVVDNVDGELIESIRSAGRVVEAGHRVLGGIPRTPDWYRQTLPPDGLRVWRD